MNIELSTYFNKVIADIRGYLLSETSFTVVEEVNCLYVPAISQIYVTLFQEGIKPLRWGSRRNNMAETIQRIAFKIKQNPRYSDFSIHDPKQCRIMFEMVTKEYPCAIRNLTTQRISKNRFEPGVNGLKYVYKDIPRFFMPTDAVTHSIMSVKQLLNYLSKQTGIAKRTNKISERVHLMRREPIEYTFVESMAYISYQDSVLPLYRGYPAPVKFSRKLMHESLLKSIDWLLENMNKDGSFLYFYDGIGDTKVDLDHPKMVNPLYNNILRHSGGTITLLRGYELTKKNSYLEAAKKSIDFFLTTFKEHTYNEQYACYPFFNSKSKLGGAGIGLAAMMHYYMHVRDESYRKQTDGLVRHLLSRVDKEGEMIGYYIHPKFYSSQAIIDPPDNIKKELFSFYYPGEALLGLALYYRHIHNIDSGLKAEIYEKSVKALDFLVDVRPKKYDYMFESLPADAWLMQAIEEWVKVEGFKKQSYIDFVFNDTQAMFDHMYTEKNAIAPDYIGGFFYNYGDHVYHDASRNEGVIAAYNLAKNLGDEERASYIMNNMLKSAKGLMHTFHTPESMYAHKFPEKSKYSFRFKLTRQWVRVDSVQHTACFFARLAMTEFDDQIIEKEKTKEFIDGLEIIKRVGKGGFGAVYLAEASQKQYALKQIHHPKYFNRIEQEIKALKVMNGYKSSLKFHRCKQVGDDVYLVFDYAKEGNLKRYIDKKGSFNEQQTIEFLQALISILRYTKAKNLLHLDIKPANILIYQNSFWLADWGLSQFGQCVETIHLKGNPIYLAPEMYQGKRCFASEIYALGCSLYYVATGKAPFDLTNNMPDEKKIYLHTYSEPDLSIVPSKILAYLITQMIEKNPLKRITLEKIEKILNSNDILPVSENKIDRSYLAEDRVEQLQQLAEDGFAYAQYRLACLYERGELIKKDRNTAYNWHDKASQQGFANAECSMGVACFRGDTIDQDYVKASEWFLKAAEKGQDKAQFFLGQMYEHGLGIEKDIEKGLDWYKESARNGYKKAHSRLLKLNVEIGLNLAE